jgi:1-acyl-sn-glycerol-3-phosphate acyltransferase
VARVLIYDSWFWRPILKTLSWVFLTLFGWRIVGKVPTQKKLVVLGAPHTSNWDFPIFLSVVGYLGLRVNYLGKHTLFTGPFAWIFYGLGGIPVNRSGPDAKDVVAQVVEEIHKREQIWLGLAPEGTRTKVEKWKTGFHRIAVEAGLPIATMYIDKKTQTVGFGPIFNPTGDLKTDLAAIQKFYSTKTAVKPENY